MTTDDATDDGERFYRQLLVISREAFGQAYYEAAYHSLMAALHIAYTLHDPDNILGVEAEATRQKTWIDTYNPSYKLSSRSASLRGNTGIYDSLLRQAAAMRLIMHDKQVHG